MIRKLILGLAGASLALAASAGVVKIGSASYSDAFPGTDAAGRNATPHGTPYLSGKAIGRPVPTNDWWSNEVANPHAQAIFNYPMALRSTASGLTIINNMIGQAITADAPLTVGVEGLSADATTISDYTDWTVNLNWKNDKAEMTATIGLGMPMVYFTKDSSSSVSIEVKMGNPTIDGNMVYVDGSYNRGAYILFAPAGSIWRKEDNRLISDLNGKNYWTVMMLPQGADPRQEASRFAKYAFAFPSDTRAEWDYNHATGEIRTRYVVTPDVKEGDSDKVLMGVLPHQWGNLATSANEFEPVSYSTARGELRMLPGNEFTTSLTFHGVLPSLPIPANADTFSAAELSRLVKEVCDNNGFDDWTDSYNDGQLINRLVQTAEAAKAAGDEEGFRTAFDLVKHQIERWMTYEEGDIAFLFYYHQPWNTMLGYPAGHGQDNNINDHNFHWGYFVRAAAFIASYEPQWADRWGEMVNLLVRDVASADRNDTMFPYLRSFSPYAGHCWANGTASLSLGNDQESTSEAMQFNTALILWADAIGDEALRDLGVYLYTTELSAIQEYWLDVHDRNLDPSFSSALASRVFGNAYDDENFWGGGIAGSYGIQIYPVHAGSFYLVENADYGRKLWSAMSEETKILQNDSDPNIWYDTWLRFLAMQDPEEALALYGKCTHLGEKFGESQAHTYQWLHAMQALGTPLMDIAASHPLAMAFEKDGLTTYVARNNSDRPLEVSFTDGFKMNVASHSTGIETAGALNPRITLDFSETSVEAGTPLFLNVLVTIPEEAGVSIVRIDYLLDGEVIASSATEPYSAEWTPTETGTHTLAARLSVSDGQTYESKARSIKIKEPGTPDIISCTFEGTAASEGEFIAPYTIRCETKSDNSVEISARFQGNYIGFVGPWLFDESNGFKEIMMNDQGGGVYSTTLKGLSEGDVVRFRVKIAYAGNLGVTEQLTYAVGEWCDSDSSQINSIPVAEASVAPNPTDSEWILTCEAKAGEATLWNLDGIRMGRYEIIDGKATINARVLPKGQYILRLITPKGVNTLRLIRK